MAAGSTQDSIRKVLGAIKDSTKVGLAQINSEYKDLDIAIVKATNHVECPPKEKHVRTIFAATSAARPRADVAYCIHALARRISKTHNWTVALKTLMVIHRTLREGDPTFREEIVNYSRSRRLAFNLSNFKDDSSPNAWDNSSFVRAYALYLEERVECSRTLKCDLESDRFLKTKDLDTVDLLEHLPPQQQLLYRIMGCQPEGAALSNYVIQCALNLVLKESVRIYHAINDGMINLVDKFFEMEQHDASKALDIYKRNGQQTEKLSEFYEICRGLDFSRNLKFPPLEKPPQSFLTSMEQYLRDASRQATFGRRDSLVLPLITILWLNEWAMCDSLSSINLNTFMEIGKEDKDDRGKKSLNVPALEYKQTEPEESVLPPVEPEKKVPLPATPVVTPSTDSVDLLGLDDVKPDPSALEESNALALAIVSTSNGTSLDNENKGPDNTAGVTGWELALVTTSSNDNALSQSKLAGGFDRLTLDSLYDDAMSRRTYNGHSMANGVDPMAPNPFVPVQQDPFFASSNVAPPPNVQIAAIAQQQQAMMMQQQAMMMQQQMLAGSHPVNPYGYGVAYTNQYQHQTHNNPFGNPGLL